MLAARVLADHFDGVTLLERDRFPETSAARKGLPQGRHVHVLLERGRGALERFLPGLTGELVRAGAEPLDWIRDVAWMNPYGWYVRFPGDLRLLASTRDLIDCGVHAARAIAAKLPNDAHPGGGRLRCRPDRRAERQRPHRRCPASRSHG